MNCGHCGAPAVCAVCTAPIEATPREPVQLLEDIVSGAFPMERTATPADDETYFLIVARGHRNLLDQLKTLIGDMGWVQVIEDRRRDQTLLPREGREGKPFSR